MKLLFVNQIPHLKVFRQKTYLPIDSKSQSMYSLVFINNKTIQSSINLIKNPFISSNNKFHFTYIDQLYRGKIGSKTYRTIYKNERNDVYNTFKEQLKFIQTPNTIANVNSRNLYYNLYKHNEIFFNLSQKLNFKIRINEYIKYLKNIINDERIQDYKIKTMCIDVNDWVISTKNITYTNNNFNNPVFILIYSMYKFFDKFKELGNVDIIFYNENFVLRVNPSICDEKSFNLVKREIMKLSPQISLPENDQDLEKDMLRQEIKNDVYNNFTQMYSFLGDEKNDEFTNSVNDKIEEIINNNQELTNKELKDKIDTELFNDANLSKEIYKLSQEQKTGRTNESLKRDEELRQQQKEITLKNKKIPDLSNIDTNSIVIPHIDITDKVKTTNYNVTKIKYPHFEKSYNETLFHKDLINNVLCLNEKSIPTYIRNVSVEDSSDELNLKETYTFELEDINRVRHKLKFDMPKFIDDKFMYLGGNKKLIIKQNFMKPVVKTGPDEVQICGNYNKIFIRRYGKKLSSKIEKFKKLISVPRDGLTVKYGNNIAANSQYKSILEYDEISKDITYIKLKKKNCELYFNQNDIQELLKQKNIKVPENMFCIGFHENDKPILINLETQKFETTDDDIIDLVLSCIDESLLQEFEDITVGKKFMYTRATIMRKQVPIILLLGYLEGLTTVLRKANIKHQFSDKRPSNLSVDQGVVKFADGFLIYDKYPFENSLLMNAFADIPTSGFEYVDFDEKGTYLSIFDILFNTKIIGNAFDNFYEFMIDPITKEVLQDLNYPTDFVNLVLFANKLLVDNAYMKENNQNLYRIRSNEIVNAFLYKAIANAYSQYRMTANNTNPVKISIPQDIVLKEILTSQIVEDYSILNPIVELEKSRSITPKGPSGMNVTEAYTQEKRSYDETMLGIMSISTSPDA